MANTGNTKKTQTGGRKQKKDAGFYVLGIAMLGFGLWFWSRMMIVGATEAVTSFQEAYETAKEDSYQEVYASSYAAAKEKYQVSSDISISLGEFREKTDLVVLHVVEEEYIVETEEQKRDGIYSWVRFRGAADFVINLRASEFIVDNDSHYVLVRVPKPEPANFHLIKDQTERIFYMDDTLEVPVFGIHLWDGSFKEGIAIAIEQENRAYKTLRDNIYKKENYHTTAEKSARQQIDAIIRSINTDKSLEDLVIDVEFY